jgi:serine/threonine protein kinase
VPRPIASLPPGTLLGAFEIVSSLGQGGMGAVYHVRNRITGDARALKVILPALAADPEFVSRFIREIRLAMAVDHPNLVRVFEPGMDGEQIFLPMELLLGESLGALLRRQHSMSIEAANGLLQAIGSALAALHAKGILHRDVKPSNIFLAQDAARAITVPKLLDLGAGREVETSEEVTATGLAVGSPHYMAPEQAAGRKDLDARVDQYALGVLAYQLLTGARPYENDDTGHVLAKVLSGAPYRRPREVLASLPAALESVIMRAMSRTREERFPNVEAFLGALQASCVGGAPPQADFADRTLTAPTRPPGVSQSATPPLPTNEPSGTMQARVVSQAAPAPRTSPVIVSVVSALAVFVLVGTVVGIQRAREPANQTAAAGVMTTTPSATPPSPSAASPSPTAPADAQTSQGAAPPTTAAASPGPGPAPPSAPIRAQPPRPTATPPLEPRTAPPRPPRPKLPAAAPNDTVEPCHATPGSPCL